MSYKLKKQKLHKWARRRLLGTKLTHFTRLHFYTSQSLTCINRVYSSCSNPQCYQFLPRSKGVKVSKLFFRRLANLDWNIRLYTSCTHQRVNLVQITPTSMTSLSSACISWEMDTSQHLLQHLLTWEENCQPFIAIGQQGELLYPC